MAKVEPTTAQGKPMAGSLSLDSFTDNQGNKVQFGIDYDDTPKAVTFWCQNDTQQRAFAQICATDGSGNDSATAVYGGPCPPGRTVFTMDTAPPNRTIPLRASPVNPNRLTGYHVLGATFPG